MRKLGWLLVVLVAVGCSNEEDPTVVVFGHSFAAGTGGVEPWPERLDEAVDNQGVDATDSKAILDLVEDYDISAAQTVVIEAGLNDARGLGVDGVDAYQRNLEAMVAAVDGATVVLLADPPIRAWDEHPPFDRGNDEVIAAYRDATQEVAAATGARFVDLGAGWDVASMVGEDGVHPNDAGAEHIAEAVGL